MNAMMLVCSLALGLMRLSWEWLPKKPSASMNRPFEPMSSPIPPCRSHPFFATSPKSPVANDGPPPKKMLACASARDVTAVKASAPRTIGTANRLMGPPRGEGCGNPPYNCGERLIVGQDPNLTSSRSEGRRVGKEWGTRWATYAGKRCGGTYNPSVERHTA